MNIGNLKDVFLKCRTICNVRMAADDECTLIVDGFEVFRVINY